jgi:hypothetical protein
MDRIRVHAALRDRAGQPSRAVVVEVALTCWLGRHRSASRVKSRHRHAQATDPPRLGQ